MGGQQSVGHTTEDLTTSFCYYDGNTAPKIESMPTIAEQEKEGSMPMLRAAFGKRFKRRVAPGNRLSMLREEESVR